MNFKCVGFFILLSISALALLAKANSSLCQSTFIDQKLFPRHQIPGSVYLPPLSADWRGPAVSPFALYRMNAPAIWAQLKNLQMQSLAARVRGLDMGDGHDFNLDFLQTRQGKSQMTLNDYDDVGRNIPMLLGAAKRAVGNTLTEYSAFPSDLWDYYLKGLSSKVVKTPFLFRKLQRLTKKDFKSSKKAYFEEITENGKKFSPESNLTLRNSDDRFTDPKIQSLFEVLNPHFENELKAQFGPRARIVDVGFKTKGSGGSLGAARFWYLLDIEGKTEVIEFKYHSGSALQLYNPEMNFEQSLSDLKKSLNTDLLKNQSTYLHTPLGNFWMRPRRPRVFTYDQTSLISEAFNGPVSNAEKKEISLYIMWLYGKWQSSLPEGQTLFSEIKADESSAYKDFIQVIESVQKMISEHQT